MHLGRRDRLRWRLQRVEVVVCLGRGVKWACLGLLLGHGLRHLRLLGREPAVVHHGCLESLVHWGVALDDTLDVTHHFGEGRLLR